MVKLRDEGKALAVGVSNFDLDLLERCEAIGHVDSLQPPFSLIERRAGRELIPWSHEHGTGVICYSPMESGILTDTFGPERVAAMDAGDWRRREDAFNEPELGRNLSLRDALRPIARRHDASVSEVADRLGAGVARRDRGHRRRAFAAGRSTAGSARPTCR